MQGQCSKPGRVEESSGARRNLSRPPRPARRASRYDGVPNARNEAGARPRRRRALDAVDVAPVTTAVEEAHR
jgi:hypothetical protein